MTDTEQLERFLAETKALDDALDGTGLVRVYSAIDMTPRVVRFSKVADINEWPEDD